MIRRRRAIWNRNVGQRQRRHVAWRNAWLGRGRLGNLLRIVELFQNESPFVVRRSRQCHRVRDDDCRRRTQCLRPLTRKPLNQRDAGTSLSGGALPLEDGVLLSMMKFNMIKEIDFDNRFAIVEPGVTNLAITRAVSVARRRWRRVRRGSLRDAAPRYHL